MLRQKARPYLFSNTLAPPVAAASIEAFNMLEESSGLRDTLEDNTKYFRAAMTEARGCLIFLHEVCSSAKLGCCSAIAVYFCILWSVVACVAVLQCIDCMLGSVVECCSLFVTLTPRLMLCCRRASTSRRATTR